MHWGFASRLSTMVVPWGGVRAVAGVCLVVFTGMAKCFGLGMVPGCQLLAVLQVVVEVAKVHEESPAWKIQE